MLLEPDDWFVQAGLENFTEILSPQTGLPGLRYLQVGVYEGSASVWLCEHVLTHPTATLTDVDTWEGGEDLSWSDFASVEARYDERVAPYAEHIRKHKQTAASFFAQARATDRDPFDFVYIDAGHRAIDTIENAVDAWHVLKVGGVLAFDDYAWRMFGDSYLHWPGDAIDAFLHLYADRLEILKQNYQVWVRRTC